MAMKNGSATDGSETEYEPDDKSTTAAPLAGSDDSELSDFSDEESEASFSDDSSAPRKKGKSKAKPKGKGKATGKFAGAGKRIDGVDVNVEVFKKRGATAHVGYVDRWDDEDSDDYDRRCYARFHNDIYQVENTEFKKEERRLKREVGRKLTNGEKNSIRLVKVSFIIFSASGAQS